MSDTDTRSWKEQISARHSVSSNPSLLTSAPKSSVSHPPHYTAGKVECIDAIESATMGLDGLEAVCVGNVLKYMWRWRFKNGVEDLRKARWYLDKLISEVVNK